MQIVHAKLVLLTEDVKKQFLDVRKIPFHWLVAYRLVEIEKTVYYSSVVHMFGNGTESVILVDILDELLAVVLTQGFHVPRDALSYLPSIDSRLVNHLV